MLDLANLNLRRIRRMLTQALSMCMVLTGAFMSYKALSVVANTSTPVVVVLSGSMEPAFQRGDILFLWNRESYAQIGDVVVYDRVNQDIPIVHRVVRDHHTDQKQLLLTKGDNNALDDLDLYGRSKMYLDWDADVTGGVVKGYIPLLGYATILMTEQPKLRTVFLGACLFLNFFQGG